MAGTFEIRVNPDNTTTLLASGSMPGEGVVHYFNSLPATDNELRCFLTELQPDELQLHRNNGQEEVWLDWICSSQSLRRLRLDAFHGTRTTRWLQAAAANQSLQCLQIACMSLTDDDVEDLLRRSACSELDFSENNMGMDVFIGLKRGLCTSKSLQKLAVKSPTDIDELMHLAEAMQENTTLHTLVIHLKYRIICKDALHAFLLLLPGMKGLKKLGFTGNPIDKEIALVLLEALKLSTTLHRLEAEFKDVPEKTQNDIQERLAWNRCGQQVYERLWEDPDCATHALWSHILSKMTGPDQSGSLYYFLQRNADLLVRECKTRKDNCLPGIKGKGILPWPLSDGKGHNTVMPTPTRRVDEMRSSNHRHPVPATKMRPFLAMAGILAIGAFSVLLHIAFARSDN